MNIIEEFDKKIETYDKNGGFIVYVEEYDNKDFDKNLIRQFILKALDDQKHDLDNRMVMQLAYQLEKTLEQSDSMLARQLKQVREIVVGSEKEMLSDNVNHNLIINNLVDKIFTKLDKLK